MSYSPFNRLQLDIFVLKKYEYYNKGYGYILCIIDVFSRKVWTYPMKSKSLSDTAPAIKKVFSTSGIHEFNSKALVIIMSDTVIVTQHFKEITVMRIKFSKKY